MQRGLFLLVMACLVAAGAAWAGPVDENQARVVARGFYASHAMSAAGLKLLQKAPGRNATDVDAKAAYYIFGGEQDNSGFVIVAGDDRVPTVLGYSDHGKFDKDDIPPALEAMLEDYTAQIDAMEQGAEMPIRMRTRQPIAPLVEAEWAQQSPYNLLLPYVANSQAVTGCVATAMAQVMYYWKWPVQTTAIPAYTTEYSAIEMPELPPTELNWDAMQDTYYTNDTVSEPAMAVAELMLYCAQSMNMNFKATSSGAFTPYMPLALSTYFGYSPDAHTLSRINFTAQEWEDIIYAELVAARPVIYSGRKSSGGHAFVCDGCDANGLFHINWGWNGKSNGYFLLNVLNPAIQGTGGNGGTYGYIKNQAILVGIEPGVGSGASNEVILTSALLDLDSYTDTRVSVTENFKALVSGRFYNYTARTFSVEQGWALYQGDTMVSLMNDSSYTDLDPGFYIKQAKEELEFGNGITGGTYQLLPVYSECGEGNWRPCVGADRNYIEVVINGNTCTFTGHGSTGVPDYKVDSIAMEGNMHPKRPVDITLYLTNKGESFNDELYMFVNGVSSSMANVSIAKGESGGVYFRYQPSAAGIYLLTFSFQSNASDPLDSYLLIIDEMPAANMTSHINVLNVLSPMSKIIVSDKFSVEIHISNKATTPYSEDITVELYKAQYVNVGAAVCAQSKHVDIAPLKSAVVRFDLDEVKNGWRYFLRAFYYSEGSTKSLGGTTLYTMMFPEPSEVLCGDVDDDGVVNIADVTALINYLLTDDATDLNLAAADCDTNGNVNIDDVSALINFLLLGTW
ncbi:MAG: C10 family peptidase [Muribaculaceae bacterium]|nr:C10 family peptidase [Muribaculaceae bacterium]